MATVQELEIIKLSKVHDNKISDLKKLNIIAPPEKKNIHDKEKLLNKYASKIKTIPKKKIEIKIPKQFMGQTFETNEQKVMITAEQFNDVVANITNENFKKSVNAIYHGLPKDDRPYEEKIKDPFVIFLTNEIALIDINKQDYYNINKDNINNILSLKSADKEQNNEAKVSIFKIWLQRIRTEIIGNEDYGKDITKRQMESKINHRII